MLFRIRDKNEAYAVIAGPKTPGRHPGILLLHGSGGSAEEEKAMAWAQRGYVAVAPEMPGLYSPLTHGDLPMTKGYADGRYTMKPDTTNSVIFDGMSRDESARSPALTSRRGHGEHRRLAASLGAAR